MRRLFARSRVASPQRNDMIDLTVDNDSQQQEAEEAGDDAATAAAAADVTQADALQTGRAASHPGICSSAVVSGGSPAAEDSPAVTLTGISPAAGAIADGSAATPTRLADTAGAGKASAGVLPADGSSAADPGAAGSDSVSRLAPATCDLLADEAVPRTPLYRQRSQQQQVQPEWYSRSLHGQQAMQASMLQEFSEAEQQFVHQCNKLQVSSQQR